MIFYKRLILKKTEYERLRHVSVFSQLQAEALEGNPIT